MKRSVELEVNRIACDGHGLCAELVPERIVMDEWGFPLIRRATVNDAGLWDTRRAVALCPALALRLQPR